MDYSDVQLDDWDPILDPICERVMSNQEVLRRKWNAAWFRKKRHPHNIDRDITDHAAFQASLDAVTERAAIRYGVTVEQINRRIMMIKDMNRAESFQGPY